MTDRLVVIGAGGFGRETLDVLDALIATRGYDCSIGVLDDSPRDIDIKRLRERRVSYIGSIESWIRDSPRDGHFVIAVGDPSTRRAIADRMKHHGRVANALVHPAATIGSMVELGPGTIICAGVRISTNITTGQHTHVNPGAIIGHDCTLGDFVSVNPGAVLSGAVNVSDGVLIGAAATVLQGLTIGASSTVGAAACVTKDVPAGIVVKGVPAR